MKMVIEKRGGYSFAASGTVLDDSRDTLIFIHGAGQSKEFWEFQVRGLSDEFNIIAIDLPGHGDSDGPAYDRVEDYASSVRTFCEVSAIKKPVLCGLSMGGAIVQQILIDHPGYLKAGIIINSGARLKVLPAIFESVRNDFQGYLNMLKDFAVAPENKSDILEDIIIKSSKCSGESTLKDFTACNNFDVMGGLEKIIDKVLIFTADKDLSTPSKYGEFIFNAVKGSKLFMVENAGHFSAIEKPEIINREIIHFLK